MTTYKINGKEYTLTNRTHDIQINRNCYCQNGDLSPVFIALYCDDAYELIVLYCDDCEGLEAELRHDYKNGAAIDPECDGEQYASDHMPEYCEMPDLDDPDQYDALRAEVYEMMVEQYQDFYADLLDELKEGDEQ